MIKWCFSTLGCADRSLSDVISLAERYGISALEIRGIGGELKNEKISDKLSREASGLESKTKKAEGNDRVVLLLDTTVACKKRFDVLADMLKQCCRTRNSKYIARYKKKLTECIKQYNSLTDEYLAISGNLSYGGEVLPEHQYDTACVVTPTRLANCAPLISAFFSKSLKVFVFFVFKLHLLNFSHSSVF